MSSSLPPEKLSPIELRATAGLASIYGLRMLGMFIILPVFAFYAEHLPGGDNYALIGIALGAYGLTQAILQVPFGWLSDRFGRKPVIYAGLILFAIGSFVAASATDIYWVIFGRIIQGSGAISAAVMALAADLTREEHRTKAMAAIGMTIGVTFALSLIIAPALNRLIGVPGIFVMTGVLALLAMVVVYRIIPDPVVSRFHSDTEAVPGRFNNVLHDPELLRLDFGVFALHAVLMALWLVVPLSLRNAGLAADQHWQVYFPVLVLSMAMIIPAIIYGEKKAKLKQVFVISVGVLLASQVLLAYAFNSLWGTATALLVFFAAFNLLEATLPSLISKIAPVGAKGTAIGVYSSVQFLGTFVGATAGGYLYQHFGSSALFGFCGSLLALWLMFAATMKAPAAVRTKMYHVQEMDTGAASGLTRQLAALPGVHEALVLASEGVAYLKVDMRGFDEQGVVQLLGGKA
ncbi:MULTISPECIES: MFS transporter [unclassified Nitrosospira]|uniref:MFS transporter n=1 Tax=unclassified Nitrosospira TaxID=2609267 RepID=UPI000D321B36|nr:MULTISPECIES: MFS transporter [unclassified Nitrosospira]PTR16939.1 putative MFS family arabinose efflux permease [Nitrosospira sp. Nsp2]WON74677.1 MFS transporter [Nitrosospira sp. Is2]